MSCEENEIEEIEETIIKLKSYKRLMWGTECDKLYGKCFDKAITIMRKYQEITSTAKRLHGKWDMSYLGDGFISCPFCREPHDVDRYSEVKDMHYCVRCGAHLD